MVNALGDTVGGEKGWHTTLNFSLCILLYIYLKFKVANKIDTEKSMRTERREFM